VNREVGKNHRSEDMLKSIRRFGNNLREHVPKIRCALNSLFFYYYFLKNPKRPCSDLLEFNLYIETTNFCNYKCAMCEASNGMERKRGFMDFGLYKKVIDDAADIGIRNIIPNVWGEPLLHPKFVEMVQYAKDKGFFVEFTTNGYLLDEAMGRKLLKTGVDSIIISFHGLTPEGYKRIHGVDGFHKVIGNVKAFCKMKREAGLTVPKVAVHPIITNDNFKNVHKVFPIFNGIVDDIKILSCAFHPGSNTNDLRLVRVPVQRRNPCIELFTTLAVSWDGKVGLCHRDREFKLMLGDAKEGLLKLFNSEKTRRYRRLHMFGQFDRMPVCAKCVDYNVDEDSIPSTLRRKIINGDLKNLSKNEIEFLESNGRCV
jgi:pyruvate-formate lyase-activating enzyme